MNELKPGMMIKRLPNGPIWQVLPYEQWNELRRAAGQATTVVIEEATALDEGVLDYVHPVRIWPLGYRSFFEIEWTPHPDFTLWPEDEFDRWVYEVRREREAAVQSQVS